MSRLIIKYHREYRDLPMSELKRGFVANCFLENWYRLKPGLLPGEQIKKINGFCNESVRYYFEIRCRGEEGWQALKELCSHPDESARLNAAAFYRLRDPDFAIPIIREMSQDPNFWAPKTVRRHVAFDAAFLIDLLDEIAAGKRPPLPNIYDSWVKDMEEEAKGRQPKVKYVEAVIPYGKEYSGLSLEEIRSKFVELSHSIQFAKIAGEYSMAKIDKIGREAERELYRLYFELRERGGDALNILREIATSGPMPAQLQAGRLLQWQDLKLACDTLTALTDQSCDYEQCTIEWETCMAAMPDCAVLGPVLNDTSYATLDPYDQWKEQQAKNGK